MIPTVAEICVRDIVTVGIDSTIENAVKKMAQANVRSVLVLGADCSDYYIITTNDAIEFKIQNLPMDTKLSSIVLNRAFQVDSKISILEIMNQENNDNDYMVVVNENRIIGILSQTDIINNIDPQVLIKKQTIGNIMLQYSAVTVYENETTVNVIKLMKFKHVDSVIIVDNDQFPLGIFTTKDFLNIMHDNTDLFIPIKNYMNSPLQSVHHDVKIFEALEFIREKRFKRLVVTDDDGKLKGVITQSELLRLVNNKWMEIIKQKGDELSKINQKLLEKTVSLEEKASTDFLTKLYNRRKFDDIMEYEVNQVKRYKDRDLCVLLLDIDGFKYINDTYGHDIGDKILQDIARILKISSRQSDVVCRWGGEEFAIALSETNLENALIVSEKIRITIEHHTFTNDLRLTCSFGISQYHTNDTYSSLFKRADEALYKAKNTGKNKVVIEHL